MIPSGEESLATSLVPPESVDNPNREFTKGEPQPTQCRDAWAAILFYAQFIAIIAVAAVLGVPAVKDFTEVDDANNTTNNKNYIGLLYGGFLLRWFSSKFISVFE